MDLLNRSNLQNKLWESVLNLRNGQVYNNSSNEFISIIDMCRQNKNDNPDLIYGRHDGTVLKRLVSALSFRPTVITSMPLANNHFSTNPYANNHNQLVTNIPMINMKLPFTTGSEEAPVSLSEAKNSSQLFVNSDNKLEYRQTSIIYSRGVLMFYIDRRANVIKLNNYQPFNLNNLPLASSAFEKINKRKVIADRQIRINEDVYDLRSIVCALTNDTLGQGNMVIGSSTMLINKDGNRYGYNPYKPNLGSKPIDTLNPTYYDHDQTNGTVFIYELTEDSSKGEFHFYIGRFINELIHK